MNWLKQNWKTTLAGLLSLAATGYAISQNPGTAISNPQTISTILAGVGLLAAADSGQKPAAQ